MAVRAPNPNRCRPRSGEYMTVHEIGGFVTVFFAAKTLGMAYGCVDTACKRGHIRFARIGNERLLRLEDVAAYRDRMAERRTARHG